MKAVVCYKWVLDEADITVNPSTRALDMSRAKGKISLYDKNAIEMAAVFAADNDGECIALSAGATGADKAKKDILSRGMAEGVFVEDAALENADTNLTAKTLAAKIAQLGDVDVVFCGEGAGDDYAQQVGPRIAAIMGWPVVTYATQVAYEDGKVKVTRAVEEGFENLEVQLPCVITAQGDCNTPRIPMMREILAASKKPYAVEDLASVGVDAATAIKTVSVLGNATNRKKIMIEGTPDEAADELIRLLLADGAL